MGFGAILWDEISADPCAKNPAVQRNIGGAVFNVIVHLQKLGYAAYMLSAIGADELGTETFRELSRLGIHDDFIATVTDPTCLIHVTFDARGFPRYSSPAKVSWDQIAVDDRGIEKIDKLGFDYLVYGTLEQRDPLSRATLHRVLENAHFCRTYVDLSLRGNSYGRDVLDYSMRRSSIAKMNEEEANVVKEVFGFRQTNLAELAAAFCREFDNQIVCITLGSRGALIGDCSTVIYRPGYSIAVQDTVGSGDAFSAGLLFMLGKGAPLDAACDFGNRMGALISSKKGALPPYDVSEMANITGRAAGQGWIFQRGTRHGNVPREPEAHSAGA